MMPKQTPSAPKRYPSALLAATKASISALRENALSRDQLQLLSELLDNAPRAEKMPAAKTMGRVGWAELPVPLANYLFEGVIPPMDDDDMDSAPQLHQRLMAKKGRLVCRGWRRCEHTTRSHPCSVSYFRSLCVDLEQAAIVLAAADHHIYRLI
eukprot:scaffold46385_cov38-Prasinocladus_malaysianus.AAC.1